MNAQRIETDRDPIPAQDVARIDRALAVLQEPTAPVETATEARAELERFLRAQLFGVAQRRAGVANDLSATDLYHSALRNLLNQFAERKSYRPADTEELCAAFCRLLYQETVNHLRQLKKKPKAELPHAIPANASEPRRVPEALALDCLEEAVIWLDRNRPELSTAFKARLLVNHNLRFSQADGSFSRFLREQVRSRSATDVEMAALLGISSREAKKRYNEAVTALRGKFPDGFLPIAPEGR